jgi:hypothetical protein
VRRSAAALLVAFGLALGFGCSGARPLEVDAAPDPIDLWRARAESLRGLPFLRPVSVRVLVRSEAGEMMRAELRAMMTPAEFAAYRDAYAALGVLPPDADLLALFAQIYSEQMVGRYSPREGALYLPESTTPSGYARETVAVHEFVHALQHQHAPHTFALAERLRHNDDVVSSLAAALEGDASFTMLGAEDGDTETERDLASARRFRDLMLADLAAPSGALLNAPLVIRLSVILPYAHGVMLAARRYAAGGNAALDTLIQDAPLSTSELLSEGVDAGTAGTAFVRLPLAELARVLVPQGCTLGHHNVAGSLNLLALFEEQGFAAEQAEEIARGWRGDRFVRVDCAGGAELLWLTVWSSEAAAARFERAYRSIAGALARRVPLAGEPALRREGSRVLVVTPGLAGVTALVAAGAELRSYAGLSSWIADGCFGEEDGCPLAGNDRGSAPLQIQAALGFSDDSGSVAEGMGCPRSE